MCPPILMYIPIPTSKITQKQKTKKNHKIIQIEAKLIRCFRPSTILGGGCYNTALRCLIII